MRLSIAVRSATLLLLGSCSTHSPNPGDASAPVPSSTPEGSPPPELATDAARDGQGAVKVSHEGGVMERAEGGAPRGVVEDETPQVREVGAALSAVDSCEAVSDALRNQAIVDMNRALDSALERYLGPPVNCVPYDAGVASCNWGSAPGPADVSTTNNQVHGVDEADFVKNDDRYIYVATGGALRIIEAWPAATAHEVSSIPMTGTPLKLLLNGNRVAVYSSSASNAATGPASGQRPTGCTYGYDCEVSGDGSATTIDVFDVTNRAAPVHVRRLEHSGSLIAARRVETAVHTVLHQAAPRFPWSAYPAGISQCGSTKLPPTEARAAFDKLRRDNLEAIRGTEVNVVPKLVDRTAADGAVTESVLGGCGGIYAASRAAGSGLLTILSLDMETLAPPHTSTVLSRAGVVYSSANALYLSVREAPGNGSPWYAGYGSIKQASVIHKFTLEGARSHYAASGIVAGHALNQFSLDEHAGHLRIATTSGYVSDPTVHSTVTVLAQNGSELTAVGTVDAIAPGEDIRSVRFDGARGFIVTFKKTDPLYYLDLADPKAPKIAGELKIPGFSTYMHLMDPTHLLTIGYDADDQGSFAFFTGLRMQIFDVSNPSSPTLLHAQTIGTRGSSSEALTDHLAFNYFAPKGLLLLPMTVCEGGAAGGGQFGTTMTFSGLKVFDVSAARGFALRGQVAHPAASGATCSNWWTNASSEVKRTVVMDDWVYSISSSLLKVNALGELATDKVTVKLTD